VDPLGFAEDPPGRGRRLRGPVQHPFPGGIDLLRRLGLAELLGGVRAQQIMELEAVGAGLVDQMQVGEPTEQLGRCPFV